MEILGRAEFKCRFCSYFYRVELNARPWFVECFPTECLEDTKILKRKNRISMKMLIYFLNFNRRLWKDPRIGECFVGQLYTTSLVELYALDAYVYTGRKCLYRVGQVQLHIPPRIHPFLEFECVSNFLLKLLFNVERPSKVWKIVTKVWNIVI